MRIWPNTYHLAFMLLLISISGVAQVSENFNQSINQVVCWEVYNMEITTRNTINSGSQKKALVGLNGAGSPAHTFTTPPINFNGGGNIEFKHKLNVNAGTSRTLTVYLLREDERLIQTLYTHVYRSGGTSPNGNPTTPISTSINVTWTGVHFIKWVWEGTGTGSEGMIDDIDITGTDMSSGGNDNGHGYCRADDVVYDTVCVGTSKDYKVPLVIYGSSWDWVFYPNGTVGSLDSTLVNGPIDSMVTVEWYNQPGDYQFEATEIRPPYNTDSYNIMYNIHVLPAPDVLLAVDSVCEGDNAMLTFQFTGTGPWNISYTDGSTTYSSVFSNANSSVILPAYTSSKTITVTALSDASGCNYAGGAFPSVQVVVFPTPSTGSIWH